MKRIFYVLFMALVIFTAGCSSDEDASGAKEASNEENTSEQAEDKVEKEEVNEEADSKEENDAVDDAKKEETEDASETKSTEDSKEKVNKETKEETKTEKQEVKQPEQKEEPKSEPKQETKKEPESQPKKEPAKTTVFTDPNPQLLVNNININPKTVQYSGSTLVMDAWVTNGFDYPVWNIHDVQIQLSNDSGVIAEAYFSSLQDLQIGPKQSVIWTFQFGPDTVKMQGADLGILKTQSSTKYQY